MQLMKTQIDSCSDCIVLCINVFTKSPIAFAPDLLHQAQDVGEK